MYIKVEVSGHNFEFWSGAKDNAKMLTYDELDRIFDQLEQDVCESRDDWYTETEVNDLFAFDFDFICSLIGMTEDEVERRYNGEDEEDGED